MVPSAVIVYTVTVAPTVTRSVHGPAVGPLIEYATGVDGAVGTSSVKMAADGPVLVMVTTSAGTRCSIWCDTQPWYGLACPRVTWVEPDGIAWPGSATWASVSVVPGADATA